MSGGLLDLALCVSSRRECREDRNRAECTVKARQAKSR